MHDEKPEERLCVQAHPACKPVFGLGLWRALAHGLQR
jgi:hypothetical protein